ncbi:MAG: methyltransferase [Bacteroidia bacterium]|nr:methyltransferase [Bacteroidia bacterium]NND51029.1 methyltransferase [Flavobacteriaceae bacterium]
MSDRAFKFKQFTVEQDKCAMKIGTDSVLLGAWATLDHNPLFILDIGSGTGIIALMQAQRSNAQNIDAIEIDDSAFEQCLENFENSKWSDRLFCYHASLLEFTEDIDDQYDLIICNPPFYSESFKTENKQRNLARFADAMPFDHLITSVVKLMSRQGHFCVVLPYSEAGRFVKLAQENGLYPNKITHVKGNPDVDIKRSLIDLSFTDVPAKINELIIENKRHQYTKDYIDLTKDFYLKL